MWRSTGLPAEDRAFLAVGGVLVLGDDRSSILPPLSSAAIHASSMPATVPVACMTCAADATSAGTPTDVRTKQSSPRAPAAQLRGDGAMQPCSVSGCGYGRNSAGLCVAHVGQWHQTGRPDLTAWLTTRPDHHSGAARPVPNRLLRVVGHCSYSAVCLACRPVAGGWASRSRRVRRSPRRHPAPV